MIVECTLQNVGMCILEISPLFILTAGDECSSWKEVGDEVKNNASVTTTTSPYLRYPLVPTHTVSVPFQNCSSTSQITSVSTPFCVSALLFFLSPFLLPVSPLNPQESLANFLAKEKDKQGWENSLKETYFRISMTSPSVNE